MFNDVYQLLLLFLIQYLFVFGRKRILSINLNPISMEMSWNYASVATCDPRKISTHWNHWKQQLMTTLNKPNNFWIPNNLLAISSTNFLSSKIETQHAHAVLKGNRFFMTVFLTLESCQLLSIIIIIIIITAGEQTQNIYKTCCIYSLASFEKVYQNK